MFRKILIPINDLKLVDKSLKKLARHSSPLGEIAYLVFVSEPFLPSIYNGHTLSKYYTSLEDYDASCEAYANKLFKKAKKILEKTTIECRTLHLYDSDVVMGILKAASKLKIDAIVMASHRYSGIKAITLGNHVHKVIVNSKLPVLVL
jgi:nucleotide-binding universal stress UspA family protein